MADLLWTYKLEGGPRDGLTGPLTMRTPTVRTPEGVYRREPLTDETPHEVIYEWVGP